MMRTGKSGQDGESDWDVKIQKSFCTADAESNVVYDQGYAGMRRRISLRLRKGEGLGKTGQSQKGSDQKGSTLR
jgi:hypothetical protein